MSLYLKSATRPRFWRGLTATDGWKPVSIRIRPAPGCSTRKAGTGASIRSFLATPIPKARRPASLASERRNQLDGTCTRPVSSGWSATFAPERPPASGSSAGRGSAAVSIGEKLAGRAVGQLLPELDPGARLAHPELEREPRSVGHVVGQPVAYPLVLGELGAMRVELRRRRARPGRRRRRASGGRGRAPRRARRWARRATRRAPRGPRRSARRACAGARPPRAARSHSRRARAARARCRAERAGATRRSRPSSPRAA